MWRLSQGAAELHRWLLVRQPLAASLDFRGLQGACFWRPKHITAARQQWIAHGGCHQHIEEDCRLWRRTVIWHHRLLGRVCMRSVVALWGLGGHI